MDRALDLGFSLEEAIQRRPLLSMKSIEALRTSLCSSKIVPQSITDKQLALFLDASDGKIEVAQKVIEIYYDTRKNAPEHFLNRDPKSEEIQQCLENQDFFVLPQINGCPIIFHQVSNSKASNYYFDNAVKTFFMSIDICLHQQGPQKGIIFLFDMRHVRLSHLTRIRVSTIKKFFRYVQDGLPAKLYQIHVLNVVSFFDKILSLIKPFMRAEIFKMLHTYPPNYNLEEFYQKCIPKECLPKDFGGDLASIEELNESFKEEYYKLRDYFKAEEAQRVSYWDSNKSKNDNQTKNKTKSNEIIQNFNRLEID